MSGREKGRKVAWILDKNQGMPIRGARSPQVRGKEIVGRGDGPTWPARTRESRRGGKRRSNGRGGGGGVGGNYVRTNGPVLPNWEQRGGKQGHGKSRRLMARTWGGGKDRREKGGKGGGKRPASARKNQRLLGGGGRDEEKGDKMPP